MALVSHEVGSSTAGASCESYNPSISADGTHVAFMSCATNLVSGYSGSGNYQVYVWEAGTVTLLSHDASFATTGANCHTQQPSISADGTRIAFMSCATNLVSGYSGSGNYQVYVWEAGDGDAAVARRERCHNGGELPVHSSRRSAPTERASPS